MRLIQRCARALYGPGHPISSVLAIAAALLLAIAQIGAIAQGVLPVPVLTGHVIDQTGTLTDADRSSLEARLSGLEATKGTQLVVLIVNSTLPEDDASFANRVANQWKIGRKGIGDGVLLVVAKNDRKLRIEVAKTLEGAIPDVVAGRIIREQIAPQFKANQYAAGLNAGVDALIQRINGEALPEPDQSPAGVDLLDGFDPWTLVMLMLFIVPVAGSILRGIFGRKLGTLMMGSGVGVLAYFISLSLLLAGFAGIVAMIISLFSGTTGTSRSARKGRGGDAGFGGWGGGGGGFGSGGGFSSGGGGDFGGGGASGGW